jgi:hypothetical protein
MTELTKPDPNPQYLSLAQLTQQLGRYEAMPVPIQGWLKRGFQLALLLNLILLPLLDWLWGWLPSTGSIASEYFLFPVTSQALNWLLALAQQALAPLIYLNLASAALALPVLLNSVALTRPVTQAFHWLAWLATFPAGISATATVLIAGSMILCAGLDWALSLIAFIAVVVFGIIAFIAAIVFWLLIAGVVLAAIGAVLSD